MTPRPRLDVLIIEDNPGDARLIREMLAEAEVARFRTEVVASLAEGLERLDVDGADVVLLDLSLPDSLGLDSFKGVRDEVPDVPVVVLSGHEDEELAARAVHEGAQDYLVKGQVNAALLGRSLRYAVERQRIEEQLRHRAEELREADRRKDEFLAMLAHELRAPLPPMLAAVEVLGNEDAEPEAVAWARETVERQIGNLARLLEDLLDVSRIVHGKITVQKEPVRLVDVVRAAVDTVAPLIDRRDLRLSVAEPEAPGWLDADPTRLEQVLVNLLQNAVAYSEPGGRIWLEAAVEGEHARIRVRDDGAGMEPEFLERVFEPFTQARPAQERASGGLGLGLALVRSLVELHDGTVSARSDGPGRGSEFEVRFPTGGVSAPGSDSPAGAGAAGEDAAVAGPAGEGAAAAGPGDGGRKLRVLVVDDDRDSARGLALLVDEWGHEVHVAYDGPGGLRLAREHPPEVALLDIGMAGMDGCELARELRSDATTSDAVLWAVTGYGREEDERRSREAGFDRHLKKPVPLPKLRRLLEAVVEARAAGRDPRGAGSGLSAT